MKTKKWSILLMFVVALSTVMGISSCNKDDDSKPSSSNGIVGLYKSGTYWCGCDAKTHFNVVEFTSGKNFYKNTVDSKKVNHVNKPYPSKSGYYYDPDEGMSRTYRVEGNYIFINGTGFVFQKDGNRLVELESGEVYYKW